MVDAVFEDGLDVLSTLLSPIIGTNKTLQRLDFLVKSFFFFSLREETEYIYGMKKKRITKAELKR